MYWHKASEKVAAKRLLPISIQTNKKGNNRLGNRECVGDERLVIYCQ